MEAVGSSETLVAFLATGPHVVATQMSNQTTALPLWEPQLTRLGSVNFVRVGVWYFGIDYFQKFPYLTLEKNQNNIRLYLLLVLT
jgi:hypothetical protein